MHEPYQVETGECFFSRRWQVGLWRKTMRKPASTTRSDSGTGFIKESIESLQCHSNNACLQLLGT